MRENNLFSTTIQSNSDPDKSYFVRLIVNNEGIEQWLCGCRACLFEAREDGLCDHIDQAIIKKLKGENNAKK